MALRYYMARSSGYYAETAQTMHGTKGEARRAEVRALSKQGGGSGGIRRVKKDGTEYFDSTVKVAATPQMNPGRKVKGGRAISLRNFTGTVTRKNDGSVIIRGRKK